MDQQIQRWVKKISKGDKKAFERLFFKFYSPLYNFVWGYVNSAHIAEELVQDAFLSVWESRDRLDQEKNIKSYLYQIVRNKALNYLKHQEVVQKHNNRIERFKSNFSFQDHDFQEESEFVQAAQEAIQDLPKRARQIYLLNRKDGLTYSEISDVLDISSKTVESQMSRALKKLRQCLSQYLSGPSMNFRED